MLGKCETIGTDEFFVEGFLNLRDLFVQQFFCFFFRNAVGFILKIFLCGALGSVTDGVLAVIIIRYGRKSLNGLDKFDAGITGLHLGGCIRVGDQITRTAQKTQTDDCKDTAFELSEYRIMYCIS